MRGSPQGWRRAMDFIVVVTFETTPDNHGEALQVLDEYIDNFLKIQPGFIDSKLNEREDRGGYLHFARWRNEADFRAFAEKAKKSHAATQKFVSSMPVQLFTRLYVTIVVPTVD